MADIVALTKKVSDKLTVYPYKKVQEFPLYVNPDTGEEERLSDGWKDVGFVCNYPTVERLRVVGELSGKTMALASGGLRMTGTSQNEFLQYVMDQIITGIVGIERDGVPVDYKLEKEWLRTQFKNSKFLLDNFSYEYRENAESWEEKKQEADNGLEEKPDSSSPTGATTSATTEGSPAGQKPAQKSPSSKPGHAESTN